MARTRIVSPDFFKHFGLFSAERESKLPLRLAYEGLWCVADRDGRFRWRREIKLDVLPYDDLDFFEVLDALERYGFIVSYVVDGKRYGYIPTLGEHQTFHHREAKSKLPAPPNNLTVQDSGNPEVSPASAQGEPGASRTVSVSASASVSVTASASASVAASVSDGCSLPDAADDIDAALHEPTEPSAIARLLTSVANRAITDRWEEQTRPIFAGAGASVELADTLIAERIPPLFARDSIVAQVASSKRSEPMKSLAYFLGGIRDAWAAHNEHAAARASPPPARASPADRATPPAATKIPELTLHADV